MFSPMAMWSSKPPPVVVTRAATNGGTSSSLSISLPASLVSGNLLIVCIFYATSGSSRTLATPSGWSSLASKGNSGTDPGAYVFTKTSNGSEGATLSITASGAVIYSAVAYQISGWSGTPQFGTWSGPTTSNSPAPPSVTPTSAGSIALSLAGGQASSTTTISAYSSGYSNGQLGNNTSGSIRTFAAGAESAISGTSAVTPGNYTLSASADWLAQTVIVDSP
jgi:hypothetical protein